MTTYGDVTKAIALAGLTGIVTIIDDSVKEEIANFINLNIRPEGFIKLTSTNEYHSVNGNLVNFLILKNCPVISVDSIVDNLNNSISSKTIISTAYYVDLETGIVQLLSDKDLTDSTAIKYFTNGINSVKVTYDYGYDTVPEDVDTFATLLLGKWTLTDYQQSQADGNLKSLKIGDYTEVYDLKFMGVASKFDNNILNSYARLKVKYNKGV